MKIVRYAATAILVIGVHATQAMTEASVMQALKNQETILKATYDADYSLSNFHKVERIAQQVYEIAAQFINNNIKGAPFEQKTSYESFSTNIARNPLEKVIWGRPDDLEYGLSEIIYKVPENKRQEVENVLREARRIFDKCHTILFSTWYMQAF